MKTLYEEWLKIDKNNEVQVLKFFFKNTYLYRKSSIRKFRQGIKIKSFQNTYYFEYYPETNIILEFSVDKNNNIGECTGEIILDEFVEDIKRIHEILRK